MRDTLCNEDYLKKKIILNENYIRKNIEEIVVLQEDIKNGIQRYPRENSEIIYDTKLMLFQMIIVRFVQNIHWVYHVTALKKCICLV